MAASLLFNKYEKRRIDTKGFPIFTEVRFVQKSSNMDQDY
jgi:hypothetical protein